MGAAAGAGEDGDGVAGVGMGMAAVGGAAWAGAAGLAGRRRTSRAICCASVKGAGFWCWASYASWCVIQALTSW